MLKTSMWPWLKSLQSFCLSKYFKPAVLGIGLASFGAVAQAPLDVRVALIIGNAAYVNVPALVNPTNDAKAMANIMRKLGFKVFDVIDGDKASMERAIDQMKDQLKGQQAVAMLYYAGHGLQLDWHNYMVPVNANLKTAADVPKQTIDIEKVITTFKSSNTRMNIIILDACRDNPFEEKASGKGLAQLDAPPGTYLAFATSPGNVAEDGDAESGNGLFTHFLIKELQKPASIENVFKRVRLQVRQRSQGRQIPWDSSSLEEEFAFNDGAKYTFNPEDLIREAKEAKEKQERLKAEAEAAKQRELEVARQRELERVRLAQEQKQREIEAEIQRKREIEIAKQQELERQRMAEAQQIKEQLARQRAEAESKERERLLVLAAEEQRRLALEAEKARVKAEALAKERESQLAMAAETEKKRAQDASQALERARLAETQRLKDIEQAKAQAELEARLKKETADKQFEIQKADWDKIKDSKNVDDFYAFLNKYPSGYITEQAQFAVEQFSKTKLLPQSTIAGEKIVENKIRYRVGDTQITKVTDLNSGVLIRQESKTVERIANNQVFINVGNEADVEIFTLDGGVVKNRNTQATVSFDPPRVDVPGDELRVGKKWTSRTTEIKESWKKNAVREDHVEIVAYEEITVSAGTFKAYKLVMKSKISSGNNALNTYWVEPGWGFKIKSIRQVERLQGKHSYELHEMVSRVKGAGSY